MTILTKAQIIEMLTNDNHASMRESNLRCLELINKCGNDFVCDNSTTSNNQINRGELVEAIIKYVLGMDTTKAQAHEIDLPQYDIEIKYTTRTSYASNCSPKTKNVILINTKEIVLLNANQLIKNSKGRIAPRYNGTPIENKLIEKIKMALN